jgi:hypothetical protein
LVLKLDRPGLTMPLEIATEEFVTPIQAMKRAIAMYWQAAAAQT